MEALRQGTIRRRDAEARGEEKEATRLAIGSLELVHGLPVEQAILLTRAFAFYFELINLAETNHRKRRRHGAATERGGRAAARVAGWNAERDEARGDQRGRSSGVAAAGAGCAGVYRASD